MGEVISTHQSTKANLYPAIQKIQLYTQIISVEYLKEKKNGDNDFHCLIHYKNADYSTPKNLVTLPC